MFFFMFHFKTSIFLYFSEIDVKCTDLLQYIVIVKSMDLIIELNPFTKKICVFLTTDQC